MKKILLFLFFSFFLNNVFAGKPVMTIELSLSLILSLVYAILMIFAFVHFRKKKIEKTVDFNKL
jgi:hypothetical protein